MPFAVVSEVDRWMGVLDVVVVIVEKEGTVFGGKFGACPSNLVTNGDFVA